MRLRIGPRVCGVTAAVLGTWMGVASPSQAALSSPQAEAYVVSAQAIGGLAAVSPTPLSTYPPGGTTTVVGLHAGVIATDATLTATTAGDNTAGTSSATATADSIGVNVPLVGSLALTGINSTCNAPAAPGTATGNGIIATATFTPTIGPAVPITITPGVNQSVTVAGLGTLVFNKQSTDANGVLTVEAAELDLIGGNQVIVGFAQCGGAPPTAAVPMVSAPLAAGTGAAVAITAGAAVMRRRRDNGAETAV